MSEEAMRYDSAPARRKLILDALRDTGFVSVNTLVAKLGVSDMTVRRDLRKLERDGQVRVVHGGVSALHAPMHNPAFMSRANLESASKRAVAREALTLVESGDTIAIDAGTTAYALARALPPTFTGTLVTNSIPVMRLMLGRTSGRVIGLGGELVVESQAFAGQMTIDAIRGLRVRTLFLGAAAIDARGIYVAADTERPTKLALMDVADRVVLLADHSKFTASAPVLLCSLDRVGTLVTDSAPPPEVSRQLSSHATVVDVAKASPVR